MISNDELDDLADAARAIVERYDNEDDRFWTALLVVLLAEILDELSVFDRGDFDDKEGDGWKE